MTYPPQPSGPGWQQQPPPGQNPEQQPYGGYPDPSGQSPAGYGQPYGQAGYGQPGDGQYGDAALPNWQQAGPYGPPNVDYSQQSMGGPPMSGPPMSGGPMSGPPVSGQPMYPPGSGFPPPPPPTKSKALPVILGGVAVVVVAALVVGIVLFVRSGSDKPDHPSTASSQRAKSGPSAASSPSTAPSVGAGVQGDKIIDTATGWFFKKRDGTWRDVPQPAASEISNPVGQSVALGDGSYATIEIGQLGPDYEYSGPKDLKTVKSDLATSMLKHYYGNGAKVDAKQNHKDQQVTQYGYQAWLWAFHVTYASGGADKSEYVVIAVLDSGEGTAAAFWGSVPSGNDALEKDMLKAAGTLQKKA
ncbi:MAG: hypothetical protein WCA46_04390 [Actinocatenispora sp.]